MDFPKVLAASDTRFTNAKIIVAKNYTPLLPDGGDPSANDIDGHGTGTALAAAGGTASTPYGPVTGVAPKAYIGSYKVLDANGGTSDVIAKAIDDAVADGMDVINISLGSYVTSYSDIDTGEVGMAAIERAARAGVIVAVAAGNQGPARGDDRRLRERAGRDHDGGDSQRSLAGLCDHDRWRGAVPGLCGRRAEPGPGDRRHAVRCDAGGFERARLLGAAGGFGGGEDRAGAARDVHVREQAE